MNGLGDGGGKELNAIHNVVVTSTDGTDGETVAAGAVSTGEDNVGSRVDGYAVILVVDGSTLCCESVLHLAEIG